MLSIRYSWPGKSSRRGRAPAAIRNRFARCAVPSMSSWFGPVNRAWPWKVATPLLASSSSILRGTPSVKPRLCRISAAQSIASPFSAIPLPSIRCAASLTFSAPRRRSFLGSHPRRAQVPPYGSESTMPTRHPWAAHLFAAVVPAIPAPITNRSKCSLMRCTAPQTRGMSARSRCGALRAADPAWARLPIHRV